MEKTTNICDCCEKVVGTFKCPICSNDCCDSCAKRCSLTLHRVSGTQLNVYENNVILLEDIKICSNCYFALKAIDFDSQTATTQKIFEILKNAIALAKISDSNFGNKMNQIKKEEENEEKRSRYTTFPNNLSPITPGPSRIYPFKPSPRRQPPLWDKYYYSKTTSSALDKSNRAKLFSSSQKPKGGTRKLIAK